MSNVEPQNVEGWYRCALSFYKIDRIPSFDIRPARNALKLVRGELNNLIHHTMLTLTQRTLHGRRVFCGSAVRCSSGSSLTKLFILRNCSPAYTFKYLVLADYSLNHIKEGLVNKGADLLN